MSRTCYSTKEKIPTTALALAGALCLAGTLAPVHAAPDPIMLSNIARGTGGFVINGTFEKGQFGSVVSGGADYNGDGASDIFVGYRSTTTPSSPQPDLNHVVFGKSDGAQVYLSTIAAGGAGGSSVGQVSSNATRLGITGGFVGDANGDGLADLVTLPRSPGFADSRFRRFVVFGRTGSGLLELSTISAGTGGFAVRGGTDGMTVLGPTFCDIAAPLGDVNGDGLSDVLMAARGNPPIKSYVVFGRTSTALTDHSTIEAGTGGFLILNAEGNFSTRLLPNSVGDINGDGLADFAIPTYGFIYIVFGKTSTTSVDVSDLGSEPNRAGWQLTVPASARWTAMGGGDINGDGLADVLAFPTSGSANGAVVFGRTATSDVAISDVRAGTGGFAINSSLPTTTWGYSTRARFAFCEAGDINGDGLSDFVIGSSSIPSVNTGNYGSSGGAYVVFGKTSNDAITLPTTTTSAIPDGFVISSDKSRASYAGTGLAPGGDINGDGLADLVVGAPTSSVGYSSQPSRLTLGLGETGQIYVVFNPLDPPEVTSYTAHVPPGDPGAVGAGGRVFGRDTTVFVDSRLWVDFADGSGPGLGGASTLATTIKRTDAGIGGGLDAAVLANVHWQVTSNRTNAVAPRVTVRYSHDEIDGLNEGGLILMTAPSAAGPFAPVGAMTRDAARNELAGTASLPAGFVIVDASPRATITRLMDNPTLDQNPSWLVAFDKPVAPTFNLFDLTPTGTLASSILINMTLSGLDPNYVVQVITQRTEDGGTIGFTIPAGAVTSGGLTSPMLVAPAYTIQAAQPATVMGDMNDDGVVNVADVTALADHIVNGTPLP